MILEVAASRAHPSPQGAWSLLATSGQGTQVPMFPEEVSLLTGHFHVHALPLLQGWRVLMSLKRKPDSGREVASPVRGRVRTSPWAWGLTNQCSFHSALCSGPSQCLSQAQLCPTWMGDTECRRGGSLEPGVCLLVGEGCLPAASHSSIFFLRRLHVVPGPVHLPPVQPPRGSQVDEKHDPGRGPGPGPPLQPRPR